MEERTTKKDFSYKDFLRENIFERLSILRNYGLIDIANIIATEVSNFREEDFIDLWNILRSDKKPILDRDTEEKSKFSVLSRDLSLKHNPDLVIFLPTTSSLLLSNNLPSLVNTITETRYRGREVILGIIRDGADEGIDKHFDTREISKILFGIPHFLIQHFSRQGYLRAIKSGLIYLKEVENLSARYAGFVDDDACITRTDHYLTLLSLLEQEGYSAVSGFAYDNNTGEILHDFFNLPTSFRFLDRRSEGINISRLHIHGGGGACLMDFEVFREGLESALKNGTLLGPTISAAFLFRGEKTIAYDGLPVLHPTKSSFASWFKMVLKYYDSWIRLSNIYGSNLTQLQREHSLKLEDAYRKIMETEDFLRFIALKKFRGSFKELLNS